MSEEDIKIGNLKLTVFEEFPFEELKKVVNAIVTLGYEATLVSVCLCSKRTQEMVI